MIIQIDTREKPQAIEKILETFDACGVSYYRSKLYVGDYVDISNMFFVIDRKQGLEEFSRNITSEHDRLIEEIRRAKQMNITICFLIENNNGFSKLEDVKNWVNPRSFKNKRSPNGNTVEKIMMTMLEHYDNIFYRFCSYEKTGQTIIQLLEEGGKCS